MNKRIKELAEQANCSIDGMGYGEGNVEKFAELLLRNLSEELYDVAKKSRKANQEWSDGVNHSAMLAQRMLMDLPQWPEEE